MPLTLKKILGLDALRKLQLARDCKRFGHTLGIKYKTKAFGIFTISSEGSNTHSSLSLLSNLLDDYQQENNSPLIGKVSDIVREQMLSSFSLFDAWGAALVSWDPSILFKILRHPITFLFRNTYYVSTHGIHMLPVNVQNHAFYVAYNTKYLAVCNRGAYVYDNVKGNNLYRLKENSPVKINKIISDVSRSFLGKGYHEKIIMNSIDEKVLDFNSKPQKIGNCSFANAKSLLKAVIYMLGNDTDIEKGYSANIEEYKKFTTWLRTHEIKMLLKKYLLAKEQGDMVAADLYVDLICCYLDNHITDIKIGSYSRSLLSIDRRSENIKLIYKFLKDDDNVLLRDKFKDINTYSALYGDESVLLCSNFKSINIYSAEIPSIENDNPAECKDSSDRRWGSRFLDTTKLFCSMVLLAVAVVFCTLPLLALELYIVTLALADLAIGFFTSNKGADSQNTVDPIKPVSVCVEPLFEPSAEPFIISTGLYEKKPFIDTSMSNNQSPEIKTKAASFQHKM